VVFSSRINWALRILVLAMAPLLALVCNIIRLVPTVYLYGYSSKDVAEQFHDLSGWVMNVVAFALLLGVLSLVRWILDQPPRTSEALTQPAGGK
jgi:exosortase/archaeosortase family protein